MPTIAGRPSIRHNQYTTAASRMAMRMPIMGLSPSGWTSMAPRPGTCSMVSLASCRLILRLGQQRMALGDRRRDVDHRAVAAARVVAEAIERLALRHAVALHEDAL